MAVKIVRGMFKCSEHGEIKEDVLYIDYEDNSYDTFCLQCIRDLLQKNITSKLEKL